MKRRLLLVLLGFGIFAGFGSGIASARRHAWRHGGCHEWSRGQEDWRQSEWRGRDWRGALPPPAPVVAQPLAPPPQVAVAPAPQVFVITVPSGVAPPAQVQVLPAPSAATPAAPPQEGR